MTRAPDSAIVRLQGGDWLKLLGLLLTHIAVMVGLLWRIHIEYEHRITILETNQAQLIKVIDTLAPRTAVR